MKAEIDIIIVNFYSEELIETCVKSIQNSDFENYNIIIVDNGSDTEILSNLTNDRIKVLTNNENKGFGHACNSGARESESEIILFLNPDTQVNKDTLKNTISFLTNRSEIAVMGCQQTDGQGSIHKTCARFVTRKNYFVKTLKLNKLSKNIFKSYRMVDWDHKTSREVNHVMGSFYAIKRSLFNELSGFDEDYFVYYEDLDLSKRVYNAGGKIYFNSEIKIYHETGGTSKNIKAQRLFYSLDALLTYSSKHLKNSSYIPIYCSVLFLEPIFRLGIALLKFNKSEILNTLKAFRLLYIKRLLKR
ncbi:glycosyltransferase family 2 protein [Croceitalea vernalis]|uniref:Glycosyltransferase family 2 protein n=1 Tax=Croceitalea vernalis TaxID=3075599 RepID=A0ABU3BEC2_9FLAO|nr:glycosyltransferase family 2 protein [Croceitalea sp. P007]MDT0620508.1 glycosyltransferase family 2 protein [Croceitalea sp. P007]